MKIVNNKLVGDQVSEKPTPNLYSPPEFKLPEYPDSIVIHYTAMNNMNDAVKVLTTKKPSGNASAHLVIGKKGEVAQLAPFNYRTWHAGVSAYKGRSGYNHLSIGIEIDNLGWLEKYDGYYSRPELLALSKPVKVKEEDVIKADHWNKNVLKKYWQNFTQAQVNTVLEICTLLKDEYKIKEIVGHDEIAPDRKLDPGPAFPLEWLRNQALFRGREDMGDEETVYFQPFNAQVLASKLNIRSGPGQNEAKVALPLIRGTQVKVIDKSGNWYKVKAEIEGWVSAEYIK